MKLPKTIRILDARYDIIPLSKEAHYDHYEGQIRHSARTIEIDEQLKPDHQLRILWHEIVHAAHALITIKDAADEEAECDLIAATVNQVLQDNPELRDLYLEMESK
jgi:phage/plasmid-associated DNA primase